APTRTLSDLPFPTLKPDIWEVEQTALGNVGNRPRPTLAATDKTEAAQVTLATRATKKASRWKRALALTGARVFELRQPAVLAHAPGSIGIGKQLATSWAFPIDEVQGWNPQQKHDQQKHDQGNRNVCVDPSANDRAQFLRQQLGPKEQDH
ncbi:MAG: hypothetical protein ACOYKM_02005, partial [Caulobacterales bacterium]